MCPSHKTLGSMNQKNEHRDFPLILNTKWKKVLNLSCRCWRTQGKYLKYSLSHFYKAKNIRGVMLLLVAMRQDFKDSDETSAGLALSECWKGLCVTQMERKAQNDDNIILYAFQRPFTYITSFKPRLSCAWQRGPRVPSRQGGEEPEAESFLPSLGSEENLHPKLRMDL